MVEWHSWGLAWLLTAPKVPGKAAEPEHWQQTTYMLLGEIWGAVISQPLYCGTVQSGYPAAAGFKNAMNQQCHPSTSKQPWLVPAQGVA